MKKLLVIALGMATFNVVAYIPTSGQQEEIYQNRERAQQAIRSEYYTPEEYSRRYQPYSTGYNPVYGTVTGAATAAEGVATGAAVAAEGVVEGTAQAVRSVIP